MWLPLASPGALPQPAVPEAVAVSAEAGPAPAIATSAPIAKDVNRLLNFTIARLPLVVEPAEVKIEVGDGEGQCAMKLTRRNGSRRFARSTKE
ncbi:hypothetical protein Amsp01_064940 [Amycolatopsis sp. NBRC 101858]|nr:hypothetical protein Amsp01_064940 [Amycolatopsis sp. NBRC 101858]